MQPELVEDVRFIHMPRRAPVKSGTDNSLVLHKRKGYGISTDAFKPTHSLKMTSALNKNRRFAQISVRVQR